MSALLYMGSDKMLPGSKAIPHTPLMRLMPQVKYNSGLTRARCLTPVVCSNMLSGSLVTMARVRVVPGGRQL